MEVTVKLSTLLEVLGALCLLVAALAWDWRAALGVVGVGLLLASYVYDVEEVEP